jgi:uncharacterized membrane protein
MPPRRALLLGTLVVGTLDILDAFIFFGLRGTPPLRILQAIASGVMGAQNAVNGGFLSAVLGLLLHYLIAFIIVLIFYAASRKIALLREHPVITGALYGVAAYFIMTFVVVPASAIHASRRWPSPPVVVNGLLIHILGVGIPAALFASAATRKPQA